MKILVLSCLFFLLTSCGLSNGFNRNYIISQTKTDELSLEVPKEK